MRDRIKGILKAVLILCISIVFIYFILRYQRFFRHISIRELRRYILSFGAMSFVILLIMYSLKPLLIVFPSLILTVLAGNIFGPVKGFILTMTGLFLSGTFAFFLSRKLGKPFVAKITRGKLLKLDNDIETHGFKIMFLMRLASIFPYDPLSYAAGLTKMKYADFILASILGVFPEMLAYSYVGESMHRPFSIKFIIPLVMVVIIAVSGSLIYKSYYRVKE